MNKTFTELTYEFETAFDEDGLLLLGNNLEFTEMLTSEYERQTGFSCVYWYVPDKDTERFACLPRDKDYTTEGYTQDFWLWLKKLEEEAYNNGAETVQEICMYIAGKFDRPAPPPFIWVASVETDEGEPPLWFFTDEEEALAWLRNRFVQHVEHTKIPREHFIWNNEDGLHQVYDGDTKWGLSVRKIRPAFDAVNP